MQTSLPSYKQIKAKYKKEKALSPIEIGRGLVFLLIDELHNPQHRKEAFDLPMLQDLTAQSKHHMDRYDMLYYTTVMVCCIRCLVHERRYWIEAQSQKITDVANIKKELEQVELIEKACAENSNAKVLKILQKLKDNCTDKTSPEEAIEETKMIRIIILQLSAIYKFVEIISEIWKLPELTSLFYTPAIKNYDNWVNAALNEVNKHLLTDEKLNIDEIKIQAENAASVHSLLQGRYLDISRIQAFLEALKEGIALTVSGSQNNA